MFKETHCSTIGAELQQVQLNFVKRMVLKAIAVGFDLLSPA